MTSFLPLLVSLSICVHLSPSCWCQMTCGPKLSSSSSARLMTDNLPCDMSRNSYCPVAGAMYPWSSVRRYIYENQGLMKRMYGDQRHAFVLRNEMEDLRDRYQALNFHHSQSSTYSRPKTRSRSAFIDSSDADEDYSKKEFQSSAPSTPSPPSSSPLYVDLNITSFPLPIMATTNPYLEPDSPLDSTESPSKSPPSSDMNQESTEQVDPKTEPIVTTMGSAPLYYPSVEPLAPSSSVPPGHDEPVTPSDPELEATTVNPESNETEPRKGFNACPIKEEVIAPFWANNTRGEVLALLNVYPFEQYVHWEKCSYELNQMFCRDGCRCEQQYRLHRLLAFDPRNECRGIFADWFRFPSCCICVCYDLPDISAPPMSNVNPSDPPVRMNRRKSRL